MSGDLGNNGLYHLHTDHLGSVAVLTKYSDGVIRWGSRTYYEPFGAFRLEPTADLTDRGLTGHGAAPPDTQISNLRNVQQPRPPRSPTTQTPISRSAGISARR